MGISTENDAEDAGTEKLLELKIRVAIPVILFRKLVDRMDQLMEDYYE